MPAVPDETDQEISQNRKYGRNQYFGCVREFDDYLIFSDTDS